MIDLHSHILPGLDDGPTDLEGSLGLARLALESGTTTMAATPHIRDDYRFPYAEIPRLVGALNAELDRAGLELEVVPAGEVAITTALELTDEALAGLCLGAGTYILVESPYTPAPGLLENVLHDLQERGFRPILAHPERAPSFLSDLPRLQRLAERGVLCSVTALSMSGGFGAVVRRFAAQLFDAGLVHNVASDAHDQHTRPPGLRAAFDDLDRDLPGLAEHTSWFTEDAPRAILAGDDLSAPPPRLRLGRRGLVRRLRGR